MDQVAERFASMPWSELFGFETTHSGPGEVTLQIDPKPALTRRIASWPR